RPDQLRLGRLDPEAWARQGLRAGKGPGRGADPARQHPRARLLPLRGEDMLTHPTHDRLVALGLTGMAKALEEQRKQPDIAALSFEERLALMVMRAQASAPSIK